MTRLVEDSLEKIPIINWLVKLGKKIKILFGGGIYSQLLVGKKGYFENFKNTKRIFQLGGLVNIGIEYQFLNNRAAFMSRYLD